MKILYVTTIGMTMSFFKTFIKQLLDEGNVVDIACNDSESPVPEEYIQWGCRVFSLSCTRSPLQKDNFKAIAQIKQLVSENQYDIVHCHTPIAAMCTRIACRKVRRSGTRVFYTAHGFHFYKGAPLKNWLLYYPVEKMCARYTDTLITINQEDYELAQRKLHAKRVAYVPGVGIDVEKFRNTQVDRNAKRREINIPESAFLLVSVGELNANKNHEVVIRAIAELNNSNIHYAIAGRGDLRDYLIKLAEELGIGNQVHLLGYRNDIAELYKASDVCVFPSIREGLGLAAIEGMACGLPVIAADNRGTRDYMINGENGYLIRYDDVSAFAKAIHTLYLNPDACKALGTHSRDQIRRYDVVTINQEMERLYAECGK